MVTRDEELKWAYLLDPCFELTNSAGKPLTDGYIEVYIAGTRNKYYCASDFAGTLHPFQIPLDSLGSNIVLANPDNAYDVYVYNRYGNLIMSRYSVTPADGGAVISNTERINELEDTLVSAVTGLQGQIDDINDALENKKDKQEPYSVTLTPTQTVSAIIQNENGEMEVIYQEIDLPDDVPNVDIVSPASTLNITTHIDEETNTKTFSIDLSDLGHLEYGQYMATEDVITGANMYRIKGNLDTTLDGKIKLHKGNSYHITVRGAYVCTDINNSVNTLDYIEYSTFTPFHVDVDNTVTDPQNFEISYDIFKLSNDTNYYIAFAASAGKVSNLTVEIHSLSNLSVIDGGNYTAGWGIDITNNVISVDQDIFNDYPTHTDVYESIVTAIDFVTGVIPDAQVQSDWDETDTSDPSYIQNKPDLSIYATHDEVVSAVSSIDLSEYTTHTEVYNATVTAIDFVTGAMPETINLTAGQNIGIFEDNNTLTIAASGTDLSDYATHTEVYNATVTAIETVTGTAPETIDLVAGQNIGIFDNGSTLTIAASGTDLTGYATESDVNSAIVTAINYVTGIIPDAQVQSNWEETDTSDPSYIQNKPNEYTVVAGQNIGISINGNDFVISASGTDLSDYTTFEDVISIVSGVTGSIPTDFTTHTEVHDAIVTAVNTVTSLIPDAQVQSDWTQSDNTQVDYIKNKPTEYTVVAGQNIGITIDGNDFVISASGSDMSDYVTEEELIEAVTAVTAAIPAAQVQSNWNETNTSSKAYIQNKPTIPNYTGASGVVVNNNTITLDNPIGLVAGDNITIEVSGVSAIISAQGGGTTYSAGNGIDITNDVISIDNTVALKTDIPVVTGFATKSELETVSGMIPEEEEVEFEELDLSNYALASAIPDISNLATIEQVSAVSAAIPELPSEEEVEFEEIDLSDYALASAIPSLNSLNTAGITDIQLVQTLPATPVSSVLYLIPEV